MSDPLDIVKELKPNEVSEPELLARVRNDLMNTIDQARQDEGTSDTISLDGARGRRRWTIPIVASAVAVLMATAAVWAVTRTPADTTNLMCPGNTIITAVTGDPIVDCSRIWHQLHGSTAPPMVAYDNGQGSVVVLLATDPAPSGSTKLKPGKVQRTALIELNAYLEDAGSGLSSGCFDVATARTMVLAQYRHLGLDDWTVTVAKPTKNTHGSSCALAVMEPAEKTVEIRPSGGNDLSSHVPFAKTLAGDLATKCLTLDQAEALTTSLVADARVVRDGTTYRFTEGGGQGQPGTLGMPTITRVVDAAATCTRAMVTVGGGIEITLRGPAS